MQRIASTRVSRPMILCAAGRGLSALESEIVKPHISTIEQLAKLALKLLILPAIALAACSGGSSYIPLDGDIVFQTSRSAQSQAIQLATQSPYSHMGIVYIQAGEPYVFEAVQPVMLTPLDAWIARGEDAHFVAKRLRNANAILTAEVLRDMRALGETMVGKDYDLYFEWSDDRIYCSELVWKIFQQGAAVEIGSLSELGSFDLSHPVVKEKIEERFGADLPLTEPVISPVAILNSPLLELVFEN